jgi:tetratricopeptide (TPR) repeat protein
MHTKASPTGAVARAFEFLATLDEARLFEKAYAERVLNEIEIVRASEFYEGEVKAGLDPGRMIALWVADRPKDAMIQADAILAGGTASADIHVLAFTIAASADPQKAISYLERADRDLTTPEERAALKDGIDENAVSAVMQPLRRARNKADLARFAEGLLRLGWPSDVQSERHDYQRMLAIDGRLAKGDAVGARALARQITVPGVVLELLVAKAYDGLLEDDDRPALLAALISAEDRRSAKALEAKPSDLKLVLRRGQFLRSLGRERDALALLLPHSADMVSVEKGGIDAFWVVNEASYALSKLGRGDEAMALMRKLVALGLEKHPDLINMAINSGVLLNDAGRHREAAKHAEQLFRVHPDKASKYGQMWMWSTATCGHALGGDTAAAQPWLARLRAAPEDNRAALMRGLLCANDLDGVAIQIIERLHGQDAGDMLVALQDYTIRGAGSASAQLLNERLERVVARPAVAAAIASKGRILKLPLSRTYWGMF